jgi:HEXXH motif-containing protein
MVNAVELNFTELFTASIYDLNNRPWLPYLTDILVKRGWEDLEHNKGITALTYGTERVMVSDSNAPRNIVAPLSSQLDTEEFKTKISIELFSGDITSKYNDAGIHFYLTEEIINKEVLVCVEDALCIMKQVPTLLTTVTSLVRSLHLLKPDSDDYDISFSEPHIPFSIFVSVPQTSSCTNHLRVAEAIVHEAMHLQLTLIEKLAPLVDISNEKYYSPWKQEYRTPQGVLHSMYVFRVVDKFLEILLSALNSSEDEASYMKNRRRQIAREIGQTKSFNKCPELTATGYFFVQQLLSFDQMSLH